MARPWRIQFSGAVYHISSRGNHRRDIFMSDIDRRDFLKLLARAAERFHLEIFAFCLMSNHFHLLLRTPEGNLSRAMQWLNTSYSVRFQLRQHLVGHLLQGRYKSTVVEDEEYWQYLSFYIHLNPVRAGMVENPAQYQWSSWLDYIKARPRFDWISREEILAQFGRTGVERRKRYRKAGLELAGKPGKYWSDFLDRAVIGSAEFVEQVKQKFAPVGKKNEVTEYRNLFRPVWEMEDLLEQVAEVFGIKEARLKDRGYDFSARLLAYWHLVENGGVPVGMVADYFKVSSAAITQGIRKADRMIFDDPKLEKLAQKLKVKI